MKDKMFDVMDLTINRDHLMEPFREMQLEFERQGDELHTIDYYDVEQIDYFLFFCNRLGSCSKSNSYGESGLHDLLQRRTSGSRYD